jgi:DNA-3-methyladenine glycosylase I
MSIGYLPGAHHANCPIHKKIAKLKPAWMQAERKGFKY